MPRGRDVDWRDLESRSDDPGVQEIIREAIRRGEIRVEPRPGGGIRIIPAEGGEGGTGRPPGGPR